MYLSTKRAAEILEITISAAHTLLRPADSREKSTRGRWSNLYLASRVYDLKAKREKGGGKLKTTKDLFHNKKRCEICGTYFRHKTNKKCKICEQGYDPNDPCGVRIISKKQGRVCPSCEDPLWEGEYECPRCSHNKTHAGIDLPTAYGCITTTRGY